MVSKDDIREKIEEVETELNKTNKEAIEVQDTLKQIELAKKSNNESLKAKLIEENGNIEELHKKNKNLAFIQNQLVGYYSELTSIISNYKNFNKILCFSNIRKLLHQNPNVKIGQIEKEAGIRLGYMSRLEKEDNTSEPSIEFIVTAAKLLNVSIDTLVSVDIGGLTSTELYLIKFFDKLKLDTLDDKLEWHRETAFNLNKMELDMNGMVQHPLFSEETFYEESDSEYPNEVTRVVFNSKTFGPHTYIAGDCFNLRLKNGYTLYLMNIEKSEHKISDTTAFAKEAWIYIPYEKTQLLITTHDKNSMAPLLNTLYSTVKEQMEHPQISKDIKYVIDSYMKDDISDDPNDLPF